MLSTPKEMLYRPNMQPENSTDVLSLILPRLKLETSVAGAFNANGEYSVEIGDYVGLKLHLVLQGEIWLSIVGEKKPLHLREGDCVLLTNGRAARFSTKQNARRTIHLDTLNSQAVNGIKTLNGGGAFFGIGLHFVFSGHFPTVLFAQLPASIVVPSHNDQAVALRANIERFRAEYMGPSLGRSIVLSHLAPIILIQILRSHAGSNLQKRNWLWALTDLKLSKAMEAMHMNPEKPWTLDSIAKVASMSRSGFALAFTKQVGLTPIQYLTHWRIQVACELLTSSHASLAEVSERVGYKSESAFSTAFKKFMKCRPGRYAKRTREQDR